MHDLGVASIRIASDVKDALAQIDDTPPDFALLDVNLGTETSFEIASRLQEQGIRFAFATGYGDQLAFPDAFADVPKLRKPYNTQSLANILTGNGSAP